MSVRFFGAAFASCVSITESDRSDGAGVFISKCLPLPDLKNVVLVVPLGFLALKSRNVYSPNNEKYNV